MLPGAGLITGANMAGSGGPLPGAGEEGSGLNDFGQIAYQFFADGQFGIAISPAIIPEPASVAVIGLGSLVMLSRRRVAAAFNR